MVVGKHELELQLRDEHQLIKQGILKDENPLNLSDVFSTFLFACRRGDLKTCQELISEGVDVNGKDAFDYTPLIIASLCGHFELVQLLLESGARAERSTFQGERAVYNALNDRIRNLLLSYDYSKSTDPLQPWASHIHSLLTKDTPTTSDIELSASSTSFRLHKFILSARSSYFRAKLSDAPETATWKLSSAVPVEAYETVFNYLYLGELPQEIVNPRSQTSEEERILTGIDKISKQLGIEQLWDAIFSADDRRLARQRYQGEVERANGQVADFFRAKVVAHKMIVDVRKVQDIKWGHDNSMFADCLLRADELPLESQDDESGNVQGGFSIGPISLPSSDVSATKHRSRAVLYPAHKAMLIRSPYFATMFSGGFMEAQDSAYLNIITLDCPPEVLELVLTFLYTEKADCPLEHALELLKISDFLLLDKLKAKAASAISSLGSNRPQRGVATSVDGGAHYTTDVETIDVYEVIRTAWQLGVQRLEEFAAKYLAERLEDYIDEPEFAAIIQESAAQLKTREETDTIELLDDIRYYLGERFRLRFEDAGLEEMLDEELAATTAKDELPVTKAETLGAESMEALQSNIEATPKKPIDFEDGGVTTLEGEVVEDEFASDALNYRILLSKIDAMLVKLNLDA